MPGRVYLVGAGPGDPELLTLRAFRLIKQADVVIYDRLVDRSILSMVPKRTRRVYAGKRPGDGEAAQKKIDELMLKEAASGNVVVRLKGGDPFLFSRGGEELEFLKKSGVEVEVVPGISSAMAVPAYAGIPLTHRKLSSSVTILTGHQVLSRQKKGVRWSKVATGADTLVVLMGMSRLPEIAARLIRGGLPPSTPLALIEAGTTDSQRTLLMTLSEACRKKKLGGRAGGPPGLIVVGKVVSLAPVLNWRVGRGVLRASRGFRTP